VNATPLAVTTLKVPVQFGGRVCFTISRLHQEEATGELVESLPSEDGCETPVDTFPPAPPQDIVAIAGTGEITVRWAESTEPDLAGYVVLRGGASDATLAEITSLPKTTTRYVDANVTTGVRYVYAVLAVDTASNRSAASARDEATAR
jgi:fibronectin type 3 domain-containing protein